MPFGLSVLAVKAIAAAVLLAALTAAYFGWQSHERGIGRTQGIPIGRAAQLAEDQAATNKLKVEAARKLADLTIDKDKAEKALLDSRNTQEATDAKNVKLVAALDRDMSRLAGPLGQLRDPYAKTVGCGGGSGGSETQTAATSSDRAGDAAAAGGLVSPELTRLLQLKDETGDRINLAYIASRADADALRQACGTP